MSGTFYYLTHPQVQVDPAVPVPDWSLSATGRARAALAARLPVFRQLEQVYSSAETKAVETARIISDALGVPAAVLPLTHENDRSATGFLPPDAFETVADAFFARPFESVRGWERAADAQSRIMAESAGAIAEAMDRDVLMVGHGAVGTLLYCRLAGLPISRRYDQPAGGGNVFAFRPAERQIVHAWTPIEAMAA